MFFSYPKSSSSNNQVPNPLLPVTCQAVVGLQLPVQILEDGADLPKALSHAVGATACVGELHHLCAGF